MSEIELLQMQAEAAEREADLTSRQQYVVVEVKKSEEQLSMDDGPSFVSPNGSFDNAASATIAK